MNARGAYHICVDPHAGIRGSVQHNPSTDFVCAELCPAELQPVQFQAPLSRATGMTLSFNPGDRLIGKYVIERLLGQGGMSTVYAAHDEQLHRHVAIKVLRESYASDPEGRKLALREARAVARLRSEHVARVLDAGVAAGDQPFIVMEYLRGEDLRERIAAGPLSVADAVGFIVQACEAITEAHVAGIAHRDLKPDNLFVTDGVDGLPQIKVLDFGIAGRASSDTDFTSTDGAFRYVGSPPYLAPERLRQARDVDKRSDIWALGVVLYEALAGRRPFEGNAVPDLVVAILDEDPPLLRGLRPEVPEPLERIVHECLNKDPAERIQSVGRLAERLLAFAPAWALPAGYRTIHMEGHANSEPAMVVAERVAALTAVSPAERISSATRAIVPRHLFVSRRNRWLAMGAAGGAVLVVVFSLLVGRNSETHSVATQPSATVAVPAHADAAPAESMNPPATTRIETSTRPVKAPARSGAARTTTSRRALPVDPLEGRR
jgi:serine/threonine-protein kinase